MAAPTRRPPAKLKTPVAQALRREKVAPVAELVALARDADTDPKLLAVRVRVWLALLEYCEPKLRSVELSGDPDRPVQLGLPGIVPLNEATLERIKREVYGIVD